MLTATLWLAFGATDPAQKRDNNVHYLPFLEDFEAMGEDTPDDWLPEGWLNINGNDNGHEGYWSDCEDDETGE